MMPDCCQSEDADEVNIPDECCAVLAGGGYAEFPGDVAEPCGGVGGERDEDAALGLAEEEGPAVPLADAV